MMKNIPDNLKKAAILVASLDRRAADVLLSNLSDNDAARVRRAVLQLEDVDVESREAVADEFLRRGPRLPDQQPAGIVLDGNLPALLASTDRVTPSTVGDEAKPQPPFHFLREVDVTRLARFLANERPQTVAIVLAHVSPDRAAEILARLPVEIKREAVRRMMNSSATQPDIVREVEQGLRAWLSSQVGDARRGSSSISEILQSADQTTREAILGDLAPHYRQGLPQDALPTPAETPPPMTFADLERADDELLARVMQTASEHIVSLALVGTSPQFVERALEQMPKQLAARQRRAIEHIVPTRLRDIDIARQQLADLAAQLKSSPNTSADNQPRPFVVSA